MRCQLRASDYQKNFVIIAVALSVILIILVGIAYTAPVHRLGDASNYYMQIASISKDFDIEYQPVDIQRVLENRFDDLPAFLLLIKTDDGRYYYGKEYSYALFAAPFYSLLDDSGILVFNAFLFWLMILMGFLYLKRNNPEITALCVSGSFFLISTAFVYIFWIHTEVYNMFLVMSGIFLWLTYRYQKDYKFLYAATIIFGIATVAKAPNIFIFAPILCYELLNIIKNFNIDFGNINNSSERKPTSDKKTVVLMFFLFILPIIAFYGIFYVNTGSITFYGGERLGYIYDFPFIGGYNAENEVGFPAFSVGTGQTSALFMDFGNIKIIPYNLFYYFFGRFTGMVWYYPFTLFAAIPLVVGFARIFIRSVNLRDLCANLAKNKEKYIILSGIILNILFYVVIIGNNYLGGQHAVGNRYFYVYPAFLFLIGYVNRKRFLAFTIIAAMILTPVLADPIGNSIYPQTITFSSPHKHLPLEYSQLDNLPTWRNHYRYSDFSLYGLDDHSRRSGDYILVDGHSNFVVRAKKEFHTFPILLLSQSDGNKIWISMSGQNVIDIQNTGFSEINISAVQPDYFDDRYYIYKLSISSEGRIFFKPNSVLPVRDSSITYGTITKFGRDGTAQRYQLVGWYDPEETWTWTDGHYAMLAFETKDTDTDLSLTILASPFLGDGSLDQQRVFVVVNGKRIGEWMFDRPSIQEKTIVIPRGVLKEGVQYITFELPDAVSPRDLGLSIESRKLAIAFRSMVIDC